MSDLVTRTAPERVYLQVSDSSYDADEKFPENIDDVSWCDHGVMACEVSYVRSDIVEQLQKERDALAAHNQIIKDFVFSFDISFDAKERMDWANEAGEIVRQPPQTSLAEVLAKAVEDISCEAFNVFQKEQCENGKTEFNHIRLQGAKSVIDWIAVRAAKIRNDKEQGHGNN